LIIVFYHCKKSGIKNNLRLINVYGYPKGLVQDQIKGDECIVKVIQVREDSLIVESCYSKMDEMLINFKKTWGKFQFKF